ncbi:MAG: LysR family transcriptional regulator [Acidobacteriota bacterium]
MNLDHLRLFLDIVEKGSLSAAGRARGLSPTTVSERLAALETHYGVTLLTRTTRSIRPTDEGRTLLDGARGVLAEADDLDQRIRRGARTLSGRIRLSAPFDLGRTTIAPVVDAFLAEHPAISIELVLSDGRVHLVDEGVDLAVRFGSLADSSLRVRSLGEHHRLPCAAPSYLARRGTPATPSELRDHDCLVMRFGQQLDDTWSFRVDGKDEVVTVRGSRLANDGGLVRAWCLDGHGIALKSELDVGADLASGALVSLLSDYLPPPTPIQLVFPPGSARPRRVRALADELAEAFLASPPDAMVRGSRSTRA